jgi:hypothetical protein
MGTFTVASVGPISFITCTTSCPNNSAKTFLRGGVKCCSNTLFDSSDKLEKDC